MSHVYHQRNMGGGWETYIDAFHLHQRLIEESTHSETIPYPQQTKLARHENRAPPTTIQAATTWKVVARIGVDLDEQHEQPQLLLLHEENYKRPGRVISLVSGNSCHVISFLKISIISQHHHYEPSYQVLKKTFVPQQQSYASNQSTRLMTLMWWIFVKPLNVSSCDVSSMVCDVISYLLRDQPSIMLLETPVDLCRSISRTLRW